MTERRNPLDLIFAGIVGALAAVVILFVFTLATGGDGTPGTSAATTTAPATTIPQESTTTAAPTTTAATTTTAAATTTAPFPGDTATKTAPGVVFGNSAFLSGVRVAQRDGYTRVVFDFEGDTAPWWQAGYRPGPFTATNGDPVPVAGSAYLHLLMSATGVDLTGQDIRITYEGPGRIEAGTVGVAEIVRVEDFEGVSVWVIGVTGERAFLVGTLQDPARIYIDVAD